MCFWVYLAVLSFLCKDNIIDLASANEVAAMNGLLGDAWEGFESLPFGTTDADIAMIFVTFLHQRERVLPMSSFVLNAEVDSSAVDADAWRDVVEVSNCRLR
jgi:hypothetical protein